MGPCLALPWNRPTRILLVVTGALLLGALFAPPADAFTVQGGSAAQQAVVTQVIQACALPCESTDAELRCCGPVTIKFVTMPGVSAYSKPGVIYINTVCAGETLAELAAHEWSHQIWYALGPKWWQKWADMADPDRVAEAGAWQFSIVENFAECARMALWSGQGFLRDYACTELKVIAPAAVRDWVTLARYVNECPFVDLAPTAMPSSAEQDELAAAAGYVASEGVMIGHSDEIFHAETWLTKRQLAAVCERAGLSCPGSWNYDHRLATRGEVRAAIPGLTWNGSCWSDPITRGQLARLIWRAQ